MFFPVLFPTKQWTEIFTVEEQSGYKR